MNRDLRPILVGLVPRSWTPEQALRAVGLLQQAIAAIRVCTVRPWAAWCWTSRLRAPIRTR